MRCPCASNSYCRYCILTDCFLLTFRAKKSKKVGPEDPIETCIGSIGKFQILVYLGVNLARLPTDFQLTSVVFLIPPTEFTCAGDATNITNQCPCLEPDFDHSVFESTVVTSWDLICDKAWLASFSQSMFQAGVLLGSLTFSGISDRYGRRIALMGALLTTPAAAAASALVPAYWTFVLFRLLSGAGVGGTMLCAFALHVELIGSSFRPYMTGLDQAAYVLAYLTVPAIAYRLRDWRHLVLATSLPWFLAVVPLYWLLPESPRWLIAVGRKKEAVQLLNKIALCNKLPTDKIEETVDRHERLRAEEPARGSFLDLFKTATIRRNSVIMAAVWMMCSFAFFGVNQYLGRLGGDIYLNVVIVAALHLPAVLIVTLAALKLRRRLTVRLSFLTAAGCLLILVFIPSELEIVRILLGSIGVNGMFVTFVMLYLYSSEIFPTVIRNSALGFASMFARIGSFVAPFVVDIGTEWISLTTFAGSALLATVLCYFLPETKGIVLKNHINDVEIASKDNKKVTTL